MTPPVAVSDISIAKLAAQAAAEVPGVSRLAPSLTGLVRKAVSKTAQQLTGTAGTADRDAPDPGAVDVDRVDDAATQVTVRIIASGHPVVLETVTAVQVAVRETLRTLASLHAEVSVVVVDTEPAMTQVTDPVA